MRIQKHINDPTHREDFVLTSHGVRVLRGREQVVDREVEVGPGLPGVSLVVEDEAAVHGDGGEGHLAERHRRERGQDGVHLVLLEL